MPLTGMHIKGPYRRSKNWVNPIVTIHNHDNHPVNKLRHEFAESTLVMEIERSAPGSWVRFEMEEITTSISGRTMSRTLSISLPMEQAKLIAKFINEGES